VQKDLILSATHIYTIMFQNFMQKLYTTLMLVLLVIGANAQAPNWAWAKSSSSNNSITSIQSLNSTTDALGNVYVTGIFDSTITFDNITLTDPTALAMFLVKYDPLGNVLWARSAGEALDMLGYVVSDICTDANGNVYVVGNYTTSITFDSITLANERAYIVKYDSSGNVLWAKGALTLANSTAADALGNVYVVGSFYSLTLTLGSFTLTNTDTSGFFADIYIVKYDASGNVLWAKSIGSTGQDEIASIATDPMGNVFVTGSFGYTPSITIGSYTLTNATNNNGWGYDIFVAKYDASGNVIWAQGAGGAGSSDYVLGVSSDASGNVFITGRYYTPSITFGSTTLFNTDTSSTAVGFESFIVKYSASGNLLWAKGIGGTGGDFGNGITNDSDGNAYVVGIYSDTISFDAFNLSNTNLGAFNIFVVKYNPSGNVIWAKQAGGTDNDYGNSISLDTFGNIFITGTYTSPQMVFGADTINNSGGYQMFLAKMGNNLIGLNDKILITEIGIYPNPSNGIFNCNQTIKTIEVYNMMGKLIITDNNTNQINLQAYPNGLYLARINGIDFCRMIKE
jgi:hypothetical protein